LSFRLGAIAAGAALAVVATAAPSFAAVDDEPAGLVGTSSTLAHVRALYERTHQRDFTRAATVMEDWRLFQDGTVGSYRVNRLGSDVRETTQLGPLTYERGVFRGVRWEQNRNGIVFTYPGVHEQRDAISDHAFRDTNDERDVRLVGESVPYNAYVVEVNPPGGRHEWLYVEKRSGNLVRREYVERRRRFVTSFDDYRLVEGVPEPSRIRTVDSVGNEREQTLVTRTLDTTPDLRDVEIPPSRRVVEFPAGSAPIRLPVRFANGLAVVRVIVGRGAYDFLLDSGAAGIVVDPTIVDQQHLERFGQHVATTLGSFPESSTIVSQMTIGPLRMRNVVARVVTVPFHVDERTHVAGLLGFDFFADAVVHFDVEKGFAEAIAPASFRAPGDTASVAVSLDDKTPAVRARVDNTVGRVVLDTGANRTIFETAFAERGDFAPERVASKTFVRGMGGFADAEAARVPTIELGGLATHDAMADVSNIDLGTDDVDGVLGTDLLRAYELWFDYRADVVYVKRAKR